MAGHSKWANIKHKKGKTDAARGKLFARLARHVLEPRWVEELRSDDPVAFYPMTEAAGAGGAGASASASGAGNGASAAP